QNQMSEVSGLIVELSKFSCQTKVWAANGVKFTNRSPQGKFPRKTIYTVRMKTVGRVQFKYGTLEARIKVPYMKWYSKKMLNYRRIGIF
ncbi:MAG: hypothetical protein M3512_15280, partial [Bacteroidota bacterium]|nr:hypothetical protein [Bacteroidota bacterium]